LTYRKVERDCHPTEQQNHLEKFPRYFLSVHKHSPLQIAKGTEGNLILVIAHIGNDPAILTIHITPLTL
jgi:hypothetical protein